MNVLTASTVYIIGIGGIGVSGVAKILLLRGAKVSGSDVAESVVTEELRELGIVVHIGHDAKNIPPATPAIIYSGAVPADNTERVAARERGIPEFSYSDALGALTRLYKTVAVSGTHGKSTTTAMLGTILSAAGWDPLVLVGTRVTHFSHGNVQWGKGEWFVVEACEHEAQMMALTPQKIIITNLEPDHLDYYGTYAKLHETFYHYVSRIAPEDCVINYDDGNVSDLFPERLRLPRSFGFQGGTLQCVARRTENGVQIATLQDEAKQQFELRLALPGEFNVMNALAALEMARSMGVDMHVSLAALETYSGSWRRFEQVGNYKGAPVISDYGHHPTAIEKTITATREFFPDRRVVLVYQPHQHHRTQALRDDFVRALSAPDVLLLYEVYDVAGRERPEDHHISSGDLLRDVQLQNPEKPMWHVTSFDATEKLFQQHVLPTDVIVIMGAGDIYQLAERLCT